MPAQQGGNGAATSRDTGSQRALRERNTLLVVRALSLEGPQTQADLARRTGLSPGTVSNIVKDLSELQRVDTVRTVSGGRRATEVTLRPDGRVVVGVDVGRTHVRVLAMDTARRPVATRSQALGAAHEHGRALEIATLLIDELLADAGVDRSRVALCGFALPASLDPRTGAVLQASLLPGWAGVDVVEAATKALDLPVVVENDANLGALYYASQPTYARARCLVYLKVATGVGAGLVLDGRLWGSASGITGEIGHNQVVEGGDVCTCGNRGCLETVASTRAIVADLARIRQDEATDLAGLVAAAEDSEPAVVRLLHEAGVVLGGAMAPICNLLSPDVIVVGGPLAHAGTALLGGLVQAARQRSLAAATARTRFTLATAEDSEVHGAALLALRRLLSEGDDLVSN